MIYPDYWVVVWDPKTPRHPPFLRLVFDGGQMTMLRQTRELKDWLAMGYYIERVNLPKAALPKRSW